jgi:hypothetical protein
MAGASVATNYPISPVDVLMSLITAVVPFEPIQPPRDPCSSAARACSAAAPSAEPRAFRIDEKHGRPGVRPQGEGGRLQPRFPGRGRQLHDHLLAAGGRAGEHLPPEPAAEPATALKAPAALAGLKPRCNVHPGMVPPASSHHHDRSASWPARPACRRPRSSPPAQPSGAEADRTAPIRAPAAHAKSSTVSAPEPPPGASESVKPSDARQEQIWLICATVTRALMPSTDERTPVQAGRTSSPG